MMWFGELEHTHSLSYCGVVVGVVTTIVFHWSKVKHKEDVKTNLNTKRKQFLRGERVINFLRG